MGNDIQNSLLEALELFSNHTKSTSNSSLTLKGKILDLQDEELGIYLVQYLDNKLPVFSSNPKVVYEVGTNVYFLVPEGDLARPKYIIGPAVPSSDAFSVAKNEEQYLKASENLIKSNEKYELCSYISSQEFPIEVNSSAFNNYLSSFRSFLFQIDVRTFLPGEQQKQGNYGAILTIPCVDANEENPFLREYSIDINNILGNPYHITSQATQSMYFNLGENIIVDTARLNTGLTFKIFQKGFPNQAADKPNDIFISNIGFYAVDVLTEQQLTGYQLKLTSAQGVFFLDQEDLPKELVPTLFMDGREISISNKDCYWFEEDMSVNSEHPDFSTYGGYGWKCLNTLRNGNYVTNVYKHNVTWDDVQVASKKYKCVIIHKDNLLSATIDIKNLSADIPTFNITADKKVYVTNTGTVTLVAHYITKDGEVSADDGYIYTWVRCDKEDKFIEQMTEKSEILTYSVAMVDLIDNVYCTIQTKGGKTLATAHIQIATEDGFTYKLVIINDDIIYKYDADGDSPMGIAYDGPLSSKISTITPLGYKVYKADGTELSEDEYRFCSHTWRVPVNSLMTVDSETKKEDNGKYYYEINNNQLAYTIANKFKKNTDNEVHLTVVFDGIELDERVNIQFLKDGDSGTNGTKCAAVIGIETDSGFYGYGERDADGNPQKLRLVKDTNYWYYILGNQWMGRLTSSSSKCKVSVKAFADGVELTSGYTVEYSWFDSKETKPLLPLNSSTGVIGATYNTQSEQDLYIVQATVKFDGDTTGKSTIYVYYPIDVLYVSGTADSSMFNISLDGGFSEVQYEPDGSNPSYDTTEYFELKNYIGNPMWTTYTNKNLILQSYYSLSEGEYVESKSTTSLASIRPGRAYQDASSCNYVEVKFDKFRYVRPIIFTYNRYGMSTLNAWDGNKIYTSSDESTFLAPLVGAGKKESDNSFTGILIGERNNSEVGLFGYSSGIQSIFLDAEDGSATFGTSDLGQIIIDPNSSTDGLIIKSSNYISGANGEGLQINFTEPSIKYGNGNFSVDKNGHLISSSATLGSPSTGQIRISPDAGLGISYINNEGKPVFSVSEKGHLVSVSATIGGWNVQPTKLTSNNITIDSAGSISSISGGNKWTLDSNGVGTFSGIAINSGLGNFSTGFGVTGTAWDQFSLLVADTAIIGELWAETATINNLVVTETARIENLVVEGIAEVEELIADEIKAVNATIGTIKTDLAEVEKAIITEAEIKTLITQKVTANYIESKLAEIGSLDVGGSISCTNCNVDGRVTCGTLYIDGEVLTGATLEKLKELV